MADAINFAVYRERMGLTYWEAMEEPAEAIEEMLAIWQLQDDRDKLDMKRQEAQNKTSA